MRLYHKEISAFEALGRAVYPIEVLDQEEIDCLLAQGWREDPKAAAAWDPNVEVDLPVGDPIDPLVPAVETESFTRQVTLTVNPANGDAPATFVVESVGPLGSGGELVPLTGDAPGTGEELVAVVEPGGEVTDEELEALTAPAVVMADLSIATSTEAL